MGPGPFTSPDYDCFFRGDTDSGGFDTAFFRADLWIERLTVSPSADVVTDASVWHGKLGSTGATVTFAVRGARHAPVT